MSSTALREPTFIAPERLYSLRGFIAASGISETRIRKARRQGIELPSITAGRRKFIRGSSAIAYIERLAEVES
jgi:hypothetical protein